LTRRSNYVTEVSYVTDGGLIIARAGRVSHHDAGEEPDVSSTNVLGARGRGMVAGLAATDAMTVPERLEMAVSGGEASQIPGQVGDHLLPGKHPKPALDVERLNGPVNCTASPWAACAAPLTWPASADAARASRISRCSGGRRRLVTAR
jgi:hypothetical protein